MRTKAHVPLTFAAFEELKFLASVVSRSSFSGDEATSTPVHPPGTFSSPLAVLVDPDFDVDRHPDINTAVTAISAISSWRHRVTVGPARPCAARLGRPGR